MDKMPKPRFPNLYREKTRHGKMVWYVRIGHGPRIRLTQEYASPEFMTQYCKALEGETPQLGQRGIKFPKSSLAWLIDRYKESSAWASLASSTRRQRELIFLTVIENSKNAPFSKITSKDIRKAREARRSTPFAANNFLKAMRKLFNWAKEAEYVSINPAIDVNFLSAKTEGHAPWTITDVKKYEERWIVGTRERVWMHVLLYTGFRLGDACAVGKQHVKDGSIVMRVEKTGNIIEIPLFVPLQQTLLAGPTGDLAWICNQSGRPFVKESFGNAFRDAVRAAGITGKSAHGLRKTLATHGAESGLTEEELQAFFGWKSSRMSGVYTKSARRKIMAMNAGKKMASEHGSNIFSRTVIQGAGEITKISTKSGV
jgi:integrase